MRASPIADEKKQRPTANASDPPFPLKLAAVLLLLVGGGHVLSIDLHALVLEYPGTWVLPAVTAAAAVGFFVCARWLYEHRLRQQPSLLPFVGAILMGHWVGLGLHEILGEGLHLPLWVSVPLAMFVVGGTAVVAHRMRHALETGRSLIREVATEHVPRIRGLILIVSRPFPGPPRFANAKLREFPITVEGRSPTGATESAQEAVVLEGRDLAADIRALNSLRWNWQQVLRALQPHLESLEHVWLLGSRDPRAEGDNASDSVPAYLADAGALIQAYCPRAAVEGLAGVDFEDFDELLQRVRPVLHRAHSAYGMVTEEIAVDVTGGFKVSSIAGAVLTLNHATVCQYVQSDGPHQGAEIRPYIYDFRWDRSLTIE